MVFCFRAAWQFLCCYSSHQNTHCLIIFKLYKHTFQGKELLRESRQRISTKANLVLHYNGSSCSRQNPCSPRGWEVKIETWILYLPTIKKRATSNFLNSSCCLTVKNSAAGPAGSSSVWDVTLGDSVREKLPFFPPVISSECILGGSD